MTAASEIFRTQYPQGSIVSDLITIQGGVFVVRTAIVNDGVTLATGLAADKNVQTAEDSALARAFNLLGITPVARSEAVSERKPQLSVVQSSSETDSITTPSSEEGAVTDLDISSEQEDLGPPIDVIEESTELASTVEDIPVESAAPVSTAPESAAPVSAAAIALENFETGTKVDLSDVIAQTDVELRRLGWTSVQGREYLEQTYGKRSRQQLTDDELMSFLLFLEEQQ